MPNTADDALAEVKRLNHATKKLLAEVSANQHAITEQLDRLDRAIWNSQSRGRYQGGPT